MIPYTNADYKRTIEMANELDEMARELTSIANRDFEGIMVGLGLSWKGENAEKFIQKCSSVKEEMLETAKQIQGIVAELRADASKMKAAQEAKAAKAVQQTASAIGATATVIRPTPPVEDVLEDVVDNVGKVAQSVVGGFGNPWDQLQDVMDDVKDAIGANRGNTKLGGGQGSFGGGGIGSR